MRTAPEAGSHDLVDLWSIRDAVELTALERNEPLRTAADKVLEEFKPGYAWMKQKLAAKTKPPAGIEYPIWAWHWASGRRKPRPDLRKKWGETGQEMALIEFAVPASSVLLSDYQTWHFPLNGWYLAKSEADQEAFDQRAKDMKTHQLRRETEASWDAVFDWDTLDAAYHGPPDEMQIQAVLWEIPPDAVRSIRRFASR